MLLLFQLVHLSVLLSVSLSVRPSVRSVVLTIPSEAPCEAFLVRNLLLPFSDRPAGPLGRLTLPLGWVNVLPYVSIILVHVTEQVGLSV